MIRSMTGYGEASAQAHGAHYFLEVRSLNSKYFKASIRLPEEYQGLEAEFESELRKRVSRGTITVKASCTDASAGAAYEINAPALDRYLAQIRATPAVAAGGLSIDVAALLGLPGVLQPPANEEERLHRARGVFLDLLDRATRGLIAMREREGLALTEDLLGHRALIAERLGRIAARSPQVVQDYQTRLRSRIESLARDSQMKLDTVELIREIAVYAERTDIAEEVKRLGGHIEQFSDLVGGAGLAGGGPVGRTLDFLAQEMLREANTIASKSPDSEISRWIVEVKGAIDRIKEQVQNVE